MKFDLIKNIFRKSEDITEKENKNLRRRNKRVQKEIDNLNEEKLELSNKYIALLEEKAKGFDQYIHYQELYGMEHELVKEQKKEIADLKTELKKAKENINELMERNEV